MARWRSVSGVIQTVLLCVGSVSAAPRAPSHDKTDVVRLANGNAITCEIKGLQRGLLQVSTDSMGTVKIEWKDVVYVESSENYRIELEDRTDLFGTLARADGPALLRVITADGPVDVPMLAVVFLAPYESTFWERIDGYVNLNLGFTKASDVGTVNVGFGTVYNDRDNRAKLDFASTNTFQNDIKTTSRHDLTLDYRRFLGKGWYAMGIGGLQRNDELGLDLRRFVGAGAGQALVRSSRALLALTAGTTFNSEMFAGSGGSSESVEGVVAVEFAIFDLESPTTDLTTSLAWFPSFTKSGRHRVDFDARLRKEIVSDFYFDLTFYSTYDSEPPPSAFSGTDFGIFSGIGYSF